MCQALKRCLAKFVIVSPAVAGRLNLAFLDCMDCFVVPSRLGGGWSEAISFN